MDPVRADVVRPASGVTSRLAAALATGLGTGYAPFAPGTAGSLLGLVAFWPVSLLSPALAVAATALAFAAGVWAAGIVAQRVGRKDPGIVVIDEVVGQWVALAFLPLTPVTVAAAFVAFRVTDVWKPWPARDLERLPGGLGIMADDVAAGVYANLLVRVLLMVVPA